MKALQDKNLLECYQKAVEFDLDHDFINMLLQEIKKRNLTTALSVSA